jgi:two-component system C4-dicarboxylate transport response regulator DctD
MSTALIVDDDFEAGQSLARLLKSFVVDLDVAAVSSAAKAKALVANQAPQVAIVDLCLEQTQGVESGFSLIAELLALDPSMRVIVLTGHADVAHGIRALQLGAASFLEKPADPPHLIALVKDALNQSQLRRAYQALRDKPSSDLQQRLCGESMAMQKLREEVLQAAQTNQAVLRLGETGTGKGVAARAIHDFSRRARNPFVRYQPNFATPDLVNSEIFGHSKGAFTGAAADRLGLLKEVGQGTFFLDEIEELPLETQVALLGSLQERVFRAVGSNREQIIECRLICASNEDPLAAIENGRLRRDFYHRLAHCLIYLPPLRERLEDIPELTSHLLDRLRAKEETSVLGIATDALHSLQSYAWPGNVRELEACIENAAYRAQFKNRTTIKAEDLKFVTAAQHSSTALSFSEQIELYKKKLLQDSLLAHGGNQLQAAKALGMERSTLRRILARG